jgi:hypothetical protein
MILGIVALAACSESGRQTSTQAPSADSPASGSAYTHDSQEVDMDNELPATLDIEQATAAARDDLAERLSIDNDAIEVVDARRVTWGNGALGCPEPGMMYTQALVPGYYIHLRYNGKDAYYHAGRDGRPMHCPAERSQPPMGSDHPDSASRI